MVRKHTGVDAPSFRLEVLIINPEIDLHISKSHQEIFSLRSLASTMYIQKRY